MKGKKTKVWLVTGHKRFKRIEVFESEVEKIREINRITWRELNDERAKKKLLNDLDINLCSLDDLEDEFNCVIDESATNPLETIIKKETINNLRKILCIVVPTLSKRQKLIIKLRFYEDKSIGEIAKKLNMAKSSVHENLERLLNKIKKLL